MYVFNVFLSFVRYFVQLSEAGLRIARQFHSRVCAGLAPEYVPVSGSLPCMRRSRRRPMNSHLATSNKGGAAAPHPKRAAQRVHCGVSVDSAAARHEPAVVAFDFAVARSGDLPLACASKRSGSDSELAIMASASASRPRRD